MGKQHIFNGRHINFVVFQAVPAVSCRSRNQHPSHWASPYQCVRSHGEASLVMPPPPPVTMPRSGKELGLTNRQDRFKIYITLYNHSWLIVVKINWDSRWLKHFILNICELIGNRGKHDLLPFLGGRFSLKLLEADQSWTIAGMGQNPGSFPVVHIRSHHKIAGIQRMFDVHPGWKSRKKKWWLFWWVVHWKIIELWCISSHPLVTVPKR